MICFVECSVVTESERINISYFYRVISYSSSLEKKRLRMCADVLEQRQKAWVMNSGP